MDSRRPLATSLRTLSTAELVYEFGDVIVIKKFIFNSLKKVREGSTS